MWFKLKLYVSVGQRCQKIKTKDVGVEKTCKTSPITDGKKLRVETVIYELASGLSGTRFYFLFPEFFFRNREASDDMRRVELLKQVSADLNRRLMKIIY